MRYLAEYIDPSTGKTRMGTANVLVRHYKDDRNALRYMHQHLRDGIWPSGQYILSAWPEGDGERQVDFLYKTA